MAEMKRGSFWHRPSTRLGWWAVGLGAVSVMISLTEPLGYVIPGLNALFSTSVFISIWSLRIPLALAAGIAGLVAVIAKRERSWLVWLTLPLFVFYIGLLLILFLYLYMM